jgi:hypothetical protein
MEATCSSEISVDFQLTTRRYIPEDRTLHLLNVCTAKRYYRYLTAQITSLQLQATVEVLPYTASFLHFTTIIYKKNFRL